MGWPNSSWRILDALGLGQWIVLLGKPGSDLDSRTQP